MISMSALEFLDTNILVYAYDRSDPRKQQIAQGLVRRAVAGEIAASSQVLGEFAATLLHKLTPRAKPEDLIALLDALAPIKLIALDGDVVLRAVQAHAQYGLHFYDGMIVACRRTRRLPEDLVGRFECRTEILREYGRKPLRLKNRNVPPEKASPTGETSQQPIRRLSWLAFSLTAIFSTHFLCFSAIARCAAGS